VFPRDHGSRTAPPLQKLTDDAAGFHSGATAGFRPPRPLPSPLPSHFQLDVSNKKYL
jgi:hypothetical protein